VAGQSKPSRDCGNQAFRIDAFPEGSGALNRTNWSQTTLFFFFSIQQQNNQSNSPSTV
jgi:hypothetical protein